MRIIVVTVVLLVLVLAVAIAAPENDTENIASDVVNVRPVEVFLAIVGLLAVRHLILRQRED